MGMMQVTSTEMVMTSRCRKVYSNAHTYHINSISLSSDRETFLSADDLRINLWHLDTHSTSFNIVDIKPANMEDLTEVRGQHAYAALLCAAAAAANSCRLGLACAAACVIMMPMHLHAVMAQIAVCRA